MLINLFTVVCIVRLVLGSDLGSESETGESGESKSLQPNIIFFLTDDLDVLLDGMHSLPKTYRIFKENGLEFRNAFAHTPVCCVSRSSILTGKYVHNHGTFNNSLKGDCASQTFVNKNEANTFANILHDAGYSTFFSGKYLNEYGNGEKPGSLSYKHVPLGWDSWYGLIGDSAYYDYALSVNGEYKEHHASDPEKDYLTTVMQNHAIEFLNSQIETDSESESETETDTNNPFLLVLSFAAAHAPFLPMNKYSDVVRNDDSLHAPQTSAWNFIDDNQHRGTILRQYTQVMSDEEQFHADLVFKLRQGTLMSVDNVIDHIHSKITQYTKTKQIVRPTYYIFTSDHGFHMGQYGLWFGKKLLYETDLRIPFYIHGPADKVLQGQATNKIALTTDIAPTIVDLAQLYDIQDSESVSVSDSRISNMDGVTLVPYLNGEYESIALKAIVDKQELYQSFLVEYYGETDLDQVEIAPNMRLLTGPSWNEEIKDIPAGDAWNNTYQCIRMMTSTTSTSSIFCEYTCFDSAHVKAICDPKLTVFGEYYNLIIDPHQLHNEYDSLSASQIANYRNSVQMLMDCSDSQCREYRNKDWNDWNSNTSIVSQHNKNNTVLMVVLISCVLFLFLCFCVFKVCLNYGCDFNRFSSQKDKENENEYEYEQLREETTIPHYDSL